MDSLEKVEAALRAIVGNDDRFRMLNARIILRTGVNLTAIKPAHLRDPSRLASVLAALSEMGFALDARSRR